jgi:hypothetical protein
MARASSVQRYGILVVVMGTVVVLLLYQAIVRRATRASVR